jgi:cytochrome oxidase Cu insertion factor (SCO1/SenC/PrrC family)
MQRMIRCAPTRSWSADTPDCALGRACIQALTPTLRARTPWATIHEAVLIALNRLGLLTLPLQGTGVKCSGLPAQNKLVYKDGRMLSLSSLKRKPCLFDFIYASCPGPCLLLTARMVRIARKLGPALGRRVCLVSVTGDPESDKARRASRLCE